MKIYVHFAILLVLSVIVLSEKTSLKKRIQTLENRQNSLEMRVNTDRSLTNDEIYSLQQDVDIFNVTLNSLVDKECPDTSRNTERVKIKQNKVSTENAEIDSYRRIVSFGVAEEKKWLRDKVQNFANNINDQKNRIDKSVSEIDDTLKGFDKATDTKLDEYKEEIDTMMLRKWNEMNKELLSQKKEIRNMLSDVSDEEEKLKNKEMFQDLHLQIRLLKENQEKTNKNMKLLDQANLDLRCPVDWVEHDSFCYLHIDVGKKYPDAREVCSKLGASVADIENKAENDFIYSVANNKFDLRLWGNNFWLGFTDEDTEGVWVSDRTGTRAVYTNWRSGQPEGGKSQQCVVIGYTSPYDKWNDLECYHQYRFVCKKSRSRLILDFS